MLITKSNKIMGATMLVVIAFILVLYVKNREVDTTLETYRCDSLLSITNNPNALNYIHEWIEIIKKEPQIFSSYRKELGDISMVNSEFRTSIKWTLPEQYPQPFSIEFKGVKLNYKDLKTEDVEFLLLRNGYRHTMYLPFNSEVINIKKIKYLSTHVKHKSKSVLVVCENG